jgi:hypothetical protein
MKQQKKKETNSTRKPRLEPGSKLLNEIKKALRELNIKQVDIYKRSKKLNQPTIGALFRGIIPHRPYIIDEIAKVLEKPAKKYRSYAVADLLDELLEEFEVTIGEVCETYKDKSTGAHQLPVYDLRTLHDAFSKKGEIEKSPAYYITARFDYGPGAYGVLIDDVFLAPRVNPGEIAIFSPTAKGGYLEEFALIGTKNQIYIGAIIETPTHVVLMTLKPFKGDKILKKDIIFLHRQTDVHRPAK